MKRFSRAEVSREVRHVLARHQVEMSCLHYQINGMEVELTGILWHSDDTNFDAYQIESLMKDFAATLPGYLLHGRTENWYFTPSSIHCLFEFKTNGEEEQVEETELIPSPESST